MGLDIEQIWQARAELAAEAIEDRHAHKVWRLPRTNIAEIAWPPHSHPFFGSWHYWWQAHYLNCLVTAAHRDPSRKHAKQIALTVRGIRTRQLLPLERNKLYDDRTWLALALDRARKFHGAPKSRPLRKLEESIIAAQTSPVGAVPWQVKSEFFNVPTNGPVAIMLARNGEIAAAKQLADWMWDTLRNEQGLIMDGWHRDNNEIETAVYPYCQGVIIGAYTEIGLALCSGGTVTPAAQECFGRVHELIIAVHEHMANARGVLHWETSGGDAGLFQGILVDYLAQAVARIPEYDAAQTQARRLAMRMVIASAEALWRHRLEVDGLPLFSADWTADAHFPVAAATDKAPVVAERDLSVQLSGWLLLEAAATVTHAYMVGRKS